MKWSPPARFSFVSVWDVAFIVADCIGNPAAYGEIFNAAGDEELSYPALVACFKEVTGIEFTVKNYPFPRLKHREFLCLFLWMRICCIPVDTASRY